MSTVTGIIDGCGSATAAIGQLVLPVLQVQLGLEYIFYLFMLAVRDLLSIECWILIVEAIITYIKMFW